MNPKYYCPVCHKRIEKPVKPEIVWFEGELTQANYYFTNHTEAICNGQCQRVTVPQAFYDAFKDKDI